MSVALGLSLAVLLVACARSGTEINADPQAQGRPVAGADVHDLVVAVDQVTGMPGWVGLHSGEVFRVPRSDPVESCEGTPGDGLESWGSTVAFRDVRYSGAGNIYVAQTIAVYGSPDEAAGVFETLRNRLASCQQRQPDGFVVDGIYDKRASWHVDGFSPVSGSTGLMQANQIQVADNVVFRVAVGIVDGAARIADSVSDRIDFNVRLVGQ